MGLSPSPSPSVAVDILVFFGSGSCGEDAEFSMLVATEMEIARFNRALHYSVLLREYAATGTPLLNPRKETTSTGQK